MQGWTRNGVIANGIRANSKVQLIETLRNSSGSDRTNHLQDQTVLNAVLCSKGLIYAPQADLVTTNYLWDRIMVKSISFLDSMYWGHSFRQYDLAAMDFYDAGVVYKI